MSVKINQDLQVLLGNLIYELNNSKAELCSQKTKQLNNSLLQQPRYVFRLLFILQIIGDDLHHRCSPMMLLRNMAPDWYSTFVCVVWGMKTKLFACHSATKKERQKEILSI